MVLAVAVVLVFPASAGAVELRFPDGRVAQPYQRWADQSPMPTPPGRIPVVTASCPGYEAVQGCTDDTTIWLAMRWRRERFVFFHELGHVFDARVMDTGARLTWSRIRRVTGPWLEWGEEGFADDYSRCSDRIGATMWGTLIPAPSLRRLKRVCSMIRRQAARHAVLFKRTH